MHTADLDGLALDGYGEIANDAARRSVFRDFAALGGDVAALRRCVEQELGSDITRLQRERTALWDHLTALRHHDELQDRLAEVRRLHDAVGRLEIDAAADALQVEEREIERALERAIDTVERTDPLALADERRANARNADRQRHHQIPPAVELSAKHEDSHLRAIRRYFVAGVIIVVHTNVSQQVRRAIEADAVAELLPSGSSVPTDERARLNITVQKHVSGRLNDLTARLISDCLFPFWGIEVTVQKVREAVRNHARRAPADAPF